MMRAIFSACLVASASAKRVSLPVPSTVLTAMGSAAEYYQQHTPLSTQDCGWETGTFYAGFMELYNVTANATVLSMATAWAAEHNYVCGGPGNDALNCNNFACGMSYASLFDIAPADYKLALVATMERAVATVAPCASLARLPSALFLSAGACSLSFLHPPLL